MTAKTTAKAELTERKILDAALKMFREKGFEQATVRDIAAAAGVATGAAYYYYPSKDAIILEFYRNSCDEMQPGIETAVERAAGFEAKLKALIRVKLDYFAPHRRVLRALLRNGADPVYPLSPFAAANRQIREVDVEWFRRILIDCSIRIPKDLEAHIPEVLWMFQMGIIYFWVIDGSAGQVRTARLLDLGSKIVYGILKLSGLPMTRRLRKMALEIIEIVKAA